MVGCSLLQKPGLDASSPYENRVWSKLFPATSCEPASFSLAHEGSCHRARKISPLRKTIWFTAYSTYHRRFTPLAPGEGGWTRYRSHASGTWSNRGGEGKPYFATGS